MDGLKKYVIISGFLMLANIVSCDIKLPGIFSSNMVIQQQKPFKIWGSAEPDEKVTVTLDGKSESILADQTGNWSLTFPAMKASFTPMEITIIGKNSIKLDNVIVGEVWLCSGQSNMRWPLANSDNGKAEVAKATNKNIRLYQVPSRIALTPQTDCPGKWKVCSPASARKFSAVGYFFGCELQRELNVPVGLISSNVGGTKIEAWTPLEYLEKIKFMEKTLKEDKVLRAAGFQKEKYRLLAKQTKAENQKLADKFDSPELQAKFSAVTLNDSEWKAMELPTIWERGLGKNFDGIVWFRKTIDIPAELVGKEITLNLGRIDDFDITFFNGQKVGAKGTRKPKRKSASKIKRSYKVSGNLVKAGKNIIAVQVLDDSRQGGMLGPAESMYIASGDKKISLAGQWKYEPAYKFGIIMRAPNAISNRPARLYMGMIHPIEGYAMRGIIWYQGEANVRKPVQYYTLMPIMIQAWRDKWNDQSLVFIQTQLANYGKKIITLRRNVAWSTLREAQAMTAEKDPLGGIAVTIDIGSTNIHPRNKKDVGKRLSLVARKLAYKQDIPYSSPMFKSMEIKNSKVVLNFDHTYGRLCTKNDEKVKGFTICGKDGKFVLADAVIDGDSIILSSDKVAESKEARYAWDTNPDCNVYNAAGLPMCPFRTCK